MAEQDVTLRTKYKYKPENGDKYITLYFESGTNDVIIDTDITDVATKGETNMTTILETLVQMIRQRAYLTIYDKAKSLKTKNLILAQGQFGVESDTGQMKVGDGFTRWALLPYIIGDDQPDGLEPVVVDDDDSIHATIGGSDVDVAMSALEAAYDQPPGTSAYVRIIELPNANPPQDG